MALDMTKLRVPPGSLLIDIVLSVVVLYGAGQASERLATVVDHLTRLESRVAAIESTGQPMTDRRLAVIESTLAEKDRRLDRIEQKIDMLIERQEARR